MILDGNFPFGLRKPNCILKVSCRKRTGPRALKVAWINFFSFEKVPAEWENSACLTPHPAMKPWPTLAWVLLLSLIDDWLKVVLSRDFTMKDIIYLHPSTTPYPGGFKCFTCKNASDNYECNRWAPDEYCPKETRYCYTLHIMDASGESLSVTKRCVTLETCFSTRCTEIRHTGQKICTSCCEGNICNLPVPRNATDAVFATTSPLNRTARNSHHAMPLILCISLLFLLTV